MARSSDNKAPVRATNLTIQDAHVRRRFPTFSYCGKESKGVWRGRLQPRSISPRYRIEVQYDLASIPKVWVLSPQIDKRVHHLYDDGSLCLYWPKEWKWRKDCLIAETIIPWSALWLYHYELWLDTGRWLGPESDHASERTLRK